VPFRLHNRPIPYISIAIIRIHDDSRLMRCGTSLIDPIDFEKYDAETNIVM
jgi:hypothetical protein